MKYKLIDTADGSKTLYLPDMDEQYHSVNGAFTESNYVFLEMGFKHHPGTSPVVFEVGFGTGLNCLLTALLAENQKRKTTFYTIEKYPLAKNTLNELNYGELISEEAKLLFKKIHECNWNELVPISPFFTLKKIEADLLTHNLQELEKADIIYFDAFGPDKQPEMWQSSIFNKIYGRCSPGATFVTYSAKGEVRRQLTAAGFSMERLPGPPGKKQMLRGIKPTPNI